MVYKYEKLGEELIKLLKQRKKNGEKFCKKCSLYDKNKCSCRVGQKPQNSAFQGNLRGERTMIRVLFICHGTL